MPRLVAGAMPILVVLVGPTGVWAIEDIKKDTIGPWEIEATFKNDKFDHCAISRSVDDVVARFVRTNDGLSLSLQSPNWKLGGKKHSTYEGGRYSWDTEVSAETNAVSVPIADKRFSSGLRAANALLVQGLEPRFKYPLIKLVMPWAGSMNASPRIVEPSKPIHSSRPSGSRK
jgi:hypothetical protein